MKRNLDNERNTIRRRNDWSQELLIKKMSEMFYKRDEGDIIF